MIKKILAFGLIVSVISLIVATQVTDFSVKDIIEKYTTPEPVEKILRGVPEAKKAVTVFEAGNEDIVLTLSKSGTSSSSSIVYVSPQISGKITDIRIETGDQVRKDQTLIVLGDSLGTDSIEIQHDSAKKSLNIAKESQNLTEESGQNSIKSAQIGVETALAAYNNAKTSKTNSLDLLEEQYDSLDLSLESAENQLETLEDNYDDIKDSIDDTKNARDDYLDQIEENNLTYNDPQIIAALDEFENALDQLKSQKKSLKDSINAAEIGIDQIYEQIDQLDATKKSQTTQLDFAIESANNQYKLALEQFEAAKTGSNLQSLASESQTSQAETGLKIAELNVEEKEIKAPISGIVTSVAAEEGNFASPGQTLVQIENNDKITIKTSVNEKEINYISKNDHVEIETNSGTVSGKIISINPIADPATKKFTIEIETRINDEINPGTLVKVNFILKSKNNIFIPLNSIFLEDEKKYVRLVKDGKIKFQEVKVGEIINEYIEITDGLRKNDKVVQASTKFLEENTEVVIE